MNNKLARIAFRIENLVKLMGYELFTTWAMADALQEDAGDVLHALHILRTDGKIELVHASNRFSNLWRLSPNVKAVYTQESMTPLSLTAAL